MKILHITPSYKPSYIYGGPIASVSMLCESIRLLSFDSSQDNVNGKAKLELQVLTTTANGKAELELKVGKPILVDGVVVNYFKRWTKDHSHFSPGLLWDLRKKISQFKNPLPSISPGESPRVKGEQEPPRLIGNPPKEANKLVIHIHAWWNLVSVLSCLVAKWYNIPVVLSPRGMLNFHTYSTGNKTLKKIIHHLIGKKLLKYCAIHATTNKEKTEIVDFINANNIIVISNLVSLGKSNIKFDQEKQCNQKFKIIFLSRINRIKGLELLFDALSDVNFDYRLTIAGTGDENYIKSLKLKAESLKLGERIKWIGQVSNDEKFSMMAYHDLLVLPSYNENFANVVVESLSVGTPVLVSKNVGLADYVKANELGWVCSLKPKDIAEKINLAYNHKLKRETIKRNAPILIKNDFDDEVLVRSYIELYDRVLRLRSE